MHPSCSLEGFCILFPVLRVLMVFPPSRRRLRAEDVALCQTLRGKLGFVNVGFTNMIWSIWIGNILWPPSCISLRIIWHSLYFLHFDLTAWTSFQALLCFSHVHLYVKVNSWIFLYIRHVLKIFSPYHRRIPVILIIWMDVSGNFSMNRVQVDPTRSSKVNERRPLIMAKVRTANKLEKHWTLEKTEQGDRMTRSTKKTNTGKHDGERKTTNWPRPREALRLIYTGEAGMIEHRWNTWDEEGQTITGVGKRTKTGSQAREEHNFQNKTGSGELRGKQLNTKVHLRQTYKYWPMRPVST